MSLPGAAFGDGRNEADETQVLLGALQATVLIHHSPDVHQLPVAEPRFRAVSLHGPGLQTIDSCIWGADGFPDVPADGIVGDGLVIEDAVHPVGDALARFQRIVIGGEGESRIHKSGIAGAQR